MLGIEYPPALSLLYFHLFSKVLYITSHMDSLFRLLSFLHAESLHFIPQNYLYVNVNVAQP